jgi:FKBP-type peptidyl-prolyl cis-trans isomerase SlyD
MTIANGKVVSIHYTLTNDDGETIDSSQGGEPLTYLHGAGNIIPGLENGLVGKSRGDKLCVKVEPELGYGPHVPEMVQEVPLSAFEGIDSIEPGMTFQAAAEDGHTQRVMVTEVTGDTVIVDGNHPLAGQNLTFDVTVVDIRDASAEEIAHRHVH